MNEHYDEVVKKCRTCSYAEVLSMSGNYLCKKYGVVKADYICKKYKLNENLPRPQAKRIMDTAQFNINDFKI